MPKKKVQHKGQGSATPKRHDSSEPRSTPETKTSRSLESSPNENTNKIDKKRFKSSVSDSNMSDVSTKGYSQTPSYVGGRMSAPVKSSSYTVDSRHDKRHSYNDANDKYGGDRSGTGRSYNRWQTSDDPDFFLYKNELDHHNGDVEYKKVKEVVSDLFEMSEEYSLAHCVAEDMSMGSGIAVPFRKKFKRVDELLNQRQVTGGLAILQDQHRFIYYLVTKLYSSGKPTYGTLFSSLKQLKKHVQNNDVKKLAMPRIGCGLDRLQWKDVKYMIEFIFQDVDVEIVVCNLEPGEESPQIRNRNCRLTNVTHPIEEIEAGTIIIYFCAEDKSVSAEMVALNEKFNFRNEFQHNCVQKSMGDVIFFSKNTNYLLCGCMVKKCKTDQIDFVALEKCINAIQKENKKYQFEYIAFQAIKDNEGGLLTHKIINIVRNSMRGVEVYVCWPGELKNDLLQEKSGHSPGLTRTGRDGSLGRRDSSRDKQLDSTPEFQRMKSQHSPPSRRSERDNSLGRRDSFRNKELELTPKSSRTKGDCTTTSVHLPRMRSQILSVTDCDRNETKSEDSSFGRSDALPYSQASGSYKSEKSEHALSWREENKNVEDFNLQRDETYVESKDSVEDASSAVTEYEMFKKEMKNIQLRKVKEQPANSLPKSYSRVCFARQDLILESGLAPGHDIGDSIGTLINQKQNEGGVAILKEGKNFLFVLIISRPTTPPTLETIFASIHKLHSIANRNGVKTLVIPKNSNNTSIDWSIVQKMFEYVFKNSRTEVVMAPFDISGDVSSLKTRNKNNPKHVRSVLHMMKKSLIVFLAYEDGYFSEEMGRLDKNFKFREEFMKKTKMLGKVLWFDRNDGIMLCGCIVRKTQNSDIDFAALQTCMDFVNNINQEKKQPVGIEAVCDPDEAVNYKIITVMLYSVRDVSINVSWPSNLKDQIPKKVT